MKSLWELGLRSGGSRWGWSAPGPMWVVCLGMAVLTFGWGGSATAATTGAGGGRVPWVGSRLVGSPEPPLPLVAERVYPGLTLKAPIHLAAEPGSDRLWVTLTGGEPDRPSRILRFQNRPDATETELIHEIPRRLVYSVCFHPGYATNGYMFMFSNGTTGEPVRTNRISRFTVERGGAGRIVPGSEVTIIEWASAGHDGGEMAFGPDGKFYFTAGDGSTDSDTLNSGQTMDDLLGSVLRIDLENPAPGRMYSVPSDNPFVKMEGARPEIWAYGLRNPWRMTLDLESGQLWVGNNGQDLWESAHLVRPGENYGWSVYEGSHPFYLGRKRGPTPHALPTIEHSHSEFRSLTGGVVYRGKRLPELVGAYIYGDYGTGRIWGMRHDGTRAVWHRELADTPFQITSFCVDATGELLVVDHGGGIYRLKPAPREERREEFPSRLSETGLFASVPEHRVAPGVMAYGILAEGWADGAKAHRFMAVPGSLRVGFETKWSWLFPDGTALVQTLTLDPPVAGAGKPVRVETRVLLRQQGEWGGYTYRWNEAQTEAFLVPREGAEAVLNPGANGAGGQPWRFPSRTECMVCHSRQANFVLGINGLQLNRTGRVEASGAEGNQIALLAQAGFFTNQPPADLAAMGRMVDPRDPAADVTARARAYLHVNCAPCHVESGGGNSRMDLTLNAAPERVNLIAARPQHDSFGIMNAMLVAPGSPDRSVLVERLSRRGTGQMPPLVLKRVDESAVRLMREWISQLKPDRAFVKEWVLDELVPELNRVQAGRKFASGQAAFRDLGCAQCHRFAGEGGSVGPDLTGVGKRLGLRELLESVVVPSAVVAEEYASHELELADGENISGRIEKEDDRIIRIMSASQPPRQVEKSRIRERRRSSLSPMPAGIVNVLGRDELLDLLAYLVSDGQPGAPQFR